MADTLPLLLICLQNHDEPTRFAFIMEMMQESITQVLDDDMLSGELTRRNTPASAYVVC
jgi:hypothetical protein